MTSAAEQAYRLAFEISPIILTDGIAASIPGGMLPIISITQAANFLTGILSGGGDLDLNAFFAHFEPMVGSTLIENTIGKYPFANQQVAANAIIVQPLRVSLRMVAPAQAGYAAKLATITALQAVLQRHNLSGGTYTVATPSCLYTDCILLRLADASTANDKTPQNAWQWDFERPLTSLAQAAAAQNSLMQKISSAVPIDGDPAWSGLSPSVGIPPSGVSPSLIPALTPLAGGSVSSVLGN